MSDINILLVVGTRPEIIKMSPIIFACVKKGINYTIAHTGQHYDYEMDAIFFQDLGIKHSIERLSIDYGSHAKFTSSAMLALEELMIKTKPDVVVVQGDTNSVLAATLVATKLQIPLAHVEAGLRSFDRRMPEEYNRIIADHCANILFAPTLLSQKRLILEQIEENSVFLTGNTIVDIVYKMLPKVEKESNILEELNIKQQKYFLMTLHRQENVDTKNDLENIINILRSIKEKYNTQIIFPIHPRTKKRLEQYNLLEEFLSLPNVKIIKPLGFLDFLFLEKNAQLILTDSGGIQEEACIMQVPCITLRDSTERPESIDVGANYLSGMNIEKILSGVEIMLGKDNNWKNPFGNGDAGESIISHICHKYGNK